MLKSYEELRSIDVRPFCENRDGLTYLNWAKCIDLLRKNGAEKVYWVPIPDEKTGNSLRMTESVFSDKNQNTNRCYETRIKVVIDDLEFEMQTPVLNGSNPVKDNSMTQLRVWTSMCRAFVKGVAIYTGLGFDLWLKEEFNEFSQVPFDGCCLASAPAITTLESICKKHKIPFEKWLKQNNRTRNTLTASEAGAMLSALKEKYGDD